MRKVQGLTSKASGLDLKTTLGLGVEASIIGAFRVSDIHKP